MITYELHCRATTAVLIPSNSGLISLMLMALELKYPSLNPLELGADQFAVEYHGRNLVQCLNPLEFGADQFALHPAKPTGLFSLNPVEFGADQFD